MTRFLLLLLLVLLPLRASWALGETLCQEPHGHGHAHAEAQGPAELPADDAPPDPGCERHAHGGSLPPLPGAALPPPLQPTAQACPARPALRWSQAPPARPERPQWRLDA